jgi:predicted ATPase
VLALLDSHRIVTLTGPGGSGKTRLALQAGAESVEQYRDGVWFVSLAAIHDP